MISSQMAPAESYDPDTYACSATGPLTVSRRLSGETSDHKTRLPSAQQSTRQIILAILMQNIVVPVFPTRKSIPENHVFLTQSQMICAASHGRQRGPHI